MAVTSVTTAMAGAINYTVVTDSSADWASVANSTYFYDKTDKLVHYKDSTGTVQEIFSGSGITVGTTPVTSGTDGRVFFQAGGVIQQDGALNWDNTNKRLGIGANATSPSAALFVRTNTLVANDIVTIQNGQYGNEIFRVRDNVTASASTVGSIFVGARLYSSGSPNTNQFDIGGYGLGSYGDFTGNSVWLNNAGNIGDGVGTSVISVSSNFYVNLQTTKKYKFEAVTGNFGIGNVGSLGARLDVRAADGLSNPVFRIRNSNDSANLFTIRGDQVIEMIRENPATNGGILITKTDAYNSPRIQLYNVFSQLTDINGSTISTSNLKCGNSGAAGFLGLVTPTGQERYLKFINLFGQETLSIGGNNYDGGATFTLKSWAGTSPGNIFTIIKNDNTNPFVITDQANVGIGGTTFGTSAKFVTAQFTGTAPTTSPTDAYQQYSADITAGNAAPHFRTENGAIIKVYQETTGVGASTLVSGGGTTLTDTDTFDGYTLKQIVKALRNQGLLA